MEFKNNVLETQCILYMFIIIAIAGQTAGPNWQKLYKKNYGDIFFKIQNIFSVFKILPATPGTSELSSWFIKSSNKYTILYYI